MRNNSNEEFTFLTCVILPIAVLIALSFVSAISFIVTLIAKGFGTELPYWPVFGCVFLICLFVRWIK